MILPVQHLRVRSLDTDRKEVSWEVSATNIDVLDYTMQVLRSEAPAGPFEPVSAAFEDRYLFVDSRIPSGHRFRQLWYLLRTTRKDTGEVTDFGPVTHEPDADLVAAYIRRSEQVLFTQVIGRACWLFKKRTFGTRCRTCWDDISKKRQRANCPDCFDTGFLRGYLNPIEVWVQIDPPGQGKQNHGQQINQETHTTGRMTFYPNVTTGDVLVEAENVRWRVTRVSRSERLRAPIKQELVLFQIQDSDIEYRLPINLEEALRDIQPSPPRMFTNPTDLNAAMLEKTPNVFANYTTMPKDPSK
jgi:hypothetical protein